MEKVVSKEEARQAIADAVREGRTIAFVPTMGALHEGHLSLVRAAKRKRAAYVVASVFVNPSQFGESTDFESYPRDLARDASLLAAEDVDLLFAPTAEVMYGPGGGRAPGAATVDPGPLGDIWEGRSRPGHFVGVATVVAKLFGILRPQLAFFGEKDYQQLRIVEKVVRDLDIATTIVACPVVRDRDGLALSSRNALLGPGDRTDALALYAALQAAEAALAQGEASADALEALMAAEFTARPGAELDYAVVVDPLTLAPMSVVDRPARALVAGRVGSVRLIDNAPLVSPKDRP